MKLKSFGCSFIYGSDLADDGHYKHVNYHSQLTWPALLAAHLGYQYECFARPGAGNLHITERVLNKLATVSADQPELFVIGWTWIDRFDYIKGIKPGDPVGWDTIRPGDTSTSGNFYYRNFHSEYQDKLTTLIYIKTVVDALNQKKCPFIMTYMDDLIFKPPYRHTPIDADIQYYVDPDPAIIDLQNYLLPYMSTFQGQNFIQWSKSKRFDISNKLHPLEEAHQAAADLVYQELDHWIIS
jgi:hypothetical protein